MATFVTNGCTVIDSRDGQYTKHTYACSTMHRIYRKKDSYIICNSGITDDKLKLPTTYKTLTNGLDRHCWPWQCQGDYHAPEQLSKFQYCSCVTVFSRHLVFICAWGEQLPEQYYCYKSSTGSSWPSNIHSLSFYIASMVNLCTLPIYVYSLAGLSIYILHR